MSSFHVDGRVSIKLEYDLAVRLGEFILNSGTEDKQLMALGYKLSNLDEEENSIQKRPVRKNYHHDIIRSTGKVLNDVKQSYNEEFDNFSKEDWPETPKTPIRIRSK
jgi:hypothetical protein